MSLSFLEASKVASSENNLDTKTCVLAASGQTEKLDIFIKAHCILRGTNCHYTTLPFNTLQQYISTTTTVNKQHIFLLFPWDVIPETDWRTGVPASDITKEVIAERIQQFIQKITRFSLKHIIYIPAPVLPASSQFNINLQLELQIQLAMLQLDATILPQDSFSLSSYLPNGSPFSSKKLSVIASAIATSLTNSVTKKILITDFDNVMWKGVIGEDGIDGIQCAAEGAGYMHYIYQSLILKLQTQGILIAGVTRNDQQTAESPFKHNKNLFKLENFIAVTASYHDKSSQIKQLLSELNLAIDSAVFIDDNPLEIEEVKSQLPGIACLQFPAKTENFPLLVDKIKHYFNLTRVTDEDKNRTELYKTRYKALAVNTEPGADLTAYLLSLKMELTIQKSEPSNIQRPLQLINKTNQFNLNGMRLTETDLSGLLLQGNTLYTFSLKDKFGDHGQIACLLLSNKNTVSYFAMSCRVFQRKVELAILYWLIKEHNLSNMEFVFKKTARNIPFQMMIDNRLYTTIQNNNLTLNTASYINTHRDILNLFTIKVENP